MDYFIDHGIGERTVSGSLQFLKTPKSCQYVNISPGRQGKASPAAALFSATQSTRLAKEEGR